MMDRSPGWLICQKFDHFDDKRFICCFQPPQKSEFLLLWLVFFPHVFPIKNRRKIKQSSLHPHRNPIQPHRNPIKSPFPYGFPMEISIWCPSYGLFIHRFPLAQGLVRQHTDAQLGPGDFYEFHQQNQHGGKTHLEPGFKRISGSV